jgi:hypothetical protein
MMSSEKQEEAEKSSAGGRWIWRQRGLCIMTGMNVLVSCMLALVAVVLVNVLAHRYVFRLDISRENPFRLSERTLSIVDTLPMDVDVTVLVRRQHELYESIRRLLHEYRYATEAAAQDKRLRVTFVDPERDLPQVRALSQQFDISQPNVLIFAAGGRTRYVEASALMDYRLDMSDGRSFSRRPVAFIGEQVVSSAIQSVLDAQRPVIYFLGGHGERDIMDFGSQAGYAALARVLRRENMDVRSLILAEHKAVPEDCSALVIAGPDRRISGGEVERISDYLDHSGRLFVMIDPSTVTGLEELLSQWGVKLAHDVAVGLTLTGRELIINRYGDHPVTRRFQNVSTMFYTPRSIEPEPAVAADDPMHADRPRVTVLANTTEEGWAEFDLNQSPPVFDEGIDRRGPVAVAVAVERGVAGDIQVGLRPTRLVVTGDSYFIANGALQGGMGGNLDFFLSSLNWLIEREKLLAIGPRDPGVLRLEMSRRDWRKAYLLATGLLPGIMALLGMLVMWSRRSG